MITREELKKLIEELEDMIKRNREEADDILREAHEEGVAYLGKRVTRLNAEADGIQMAIETIEEYL